MMDYVSKMIDFAGNLMKFDEEDEWVADVSEHDFFTLKTRNVCIKTRNELCIKNKECLYLK